VKYPIFQVDAFTQSVFSGNPAAVVLLDQWLDDATLLNIAAENNLAETAYLVKQETGSPATADYAIRWFTPKIEVDLCGHATLASAHVLFEHLGFKKELITFSSASGPLRVALKGNSQMPLYELDFPAQAPKPVTDTALLKQVAAAIGTEPLEVTTASKLLARLDSEQQIKDLSVNLTIIKQLPTIGLIVTAPGNNVDFVSRFFAPNAGIDEDPVTGSAHCVLTPYWSALLNKPRLKARQLSYRGGEIGCELKGDRVLLVGGAATFLEGTCYISN
jgi:PhzF family phenazine biosynthesis protein